jgi:hypothetical protein
MVRRNAIVDVIAAALEARVVTKARDFAVAGRTVAVVIVVTTDDVLLFQATEASA